jgi:hypothetical protein
MESNSLIQAILDKVLDGHGANMVSGPDELQQSPPGEIVALISGKPKDGEKMPAGGLVERAATLGSHVDWDPLHLQSITNWGRVATLVISAQENKDFVRVHTSIENEVTANGRHPASF